MSSDKRARAAPVLFLAILIVLSFWAGTQWTRTMHAGDGAPAAVPIPVVNPRGDLAGDEQSTIEVFQQASPSTVFITSIAVHPDRLNLSLMGMPRGSGSGFLWDERGHVVTNFHVIEGADAARVTLFDHTTWEAALVGVAPEKDLAVLRIEAPADRLRPLSLGSSGDLQIGQKVFAIGNPFRLGQTLTIGIVSALGREIASATGMPIRGVIQTDTAINPGNSGGPLLDSAGRLIAVNTALYSPPGASAGVGFAIPVDTVKRVVPDLIMYGSVRWPALGVGLAAPARRSRDCPAVCSITERTLMLGSTTLLPGTAPSLLSTWGMVS